LKTRRPAETQDLSNSERRFLDAMRNLQFGYFERVRVDRGEIVLDPTLAPVRQVKFGAADRVMSAPPEFQLKQQAADFFECIRSIDSGEIRRLEVRYGVPLVAEFEHGAAAKASGLNLTRETP